MKLALNRSIKRVSEVDGGDCFFCQYDNNPILAIKGSVSV